MRKTSVTFGYRQGTALNALAVIAKDNTAFEFPKDGGYVFCGEAEMHTRWN